MPVKPVPDGFHTVTPYLVVRDAGRLLDFLVRAFGAEVIERMASPDGIVRHAQLKVGDSMIMLGTAPPDRPPMTTMIYLYVDDADAVYRRAVAAGGVSVLEPVDQFYGDRHGAVADEFGNEWWIASHVEDVSPEEMERRAAAAFASRNH